jgi:hypothetical protein
MSQFVTGPRAGISSDSANFAMLSPRNMQGASQRKYAIAVPPVEAGHR